jgi:hypothetical protein
VSPYARTCQKTAESASPFLAPKTATGLRLRNLLLKLNYALPGRGLTERLAHSRASSIPLPTYPRPT